MGNVIKGKNLKVEGDYDPYEHRIVVNAKSNNGAILYLIKGAMGTGILAMPQAFKFSGWLLGLMFMVVLLPIVIHCMEILIESQYVLCQKVKKPFLTYPETLRVAVQSGPGFLKILSPVAELIINSLLIISQVGFLTIYVLFIASNLKVVIEESSNFRANIHIHILFYFLPIIAIESIREINRLTIIFQIGSILFVIGLGLIFSFYFNEPITLKDRLPWGHVVDYPSYLCITVFSLETISMILSIESKLKRPKDFTGWFGVMSISTILSAFLFAFVGVFGYIKYGDKVESVITLNLEAHNDLATAIRIIYSLVIYSSYPLQCYIAYEVIWFSYLQKRVPPNHGIIFELLTKYSLVIISFICALVIPNVGAFIGLMGAFCLTTLGFTLPCLIEICVLYPNNYGRFKWRLFKDLLLLVFGMFILVLGTISSIGQIIEVYAHPDKK